jgi:hypothetical protein
VCFCYQRYIAPDNVDAEILRLGNTLNSGLEPRIRYSHLVIECPAGTVLLFRIEKSWNAPHRVIFRGYDKFFARTGTGKYPLDVQQLRRAFVENNSVAERIRGFRADRLASIIAGVTPVPMARGSKLVIHLLPFDAFFSEPQFDLRERLPTNLFQPLTAGAWSDRLTFEGKMVVAASRDGLSSSYLHLYRNGVVEIVDASILNHKMTEHPDLRYIPSLAVERLIVTGVERGLGLIRHIGASAPVAVTFALTDVKGMILISSEFWQLSPQHPVLNTHLFFPDTILLELTDRIGPLLKPLFDLMFNAGGIDESPGFDAQGNWRGW